MELLKEIDVDGAVRRGKIKMKRRVYISKVSIYSKSGTNSDTSFRARITHGILISMISWLGMDSTFMVVSMGKPFFNERKLH